MFTDTTNSFGGKRVHGLVLLFAATAALTNAQVVASEPKAFASAQQLSGSYLVSIGLDAVPDVAFPGLVSYAPTGSVIANEAINFAGTPLAGATITEDHGTWMALGHEKFLVTFVKLACINGVFSYTVTTRALVTSTGTSFQGTYNLDIRDVNNNAVIPGGLNGTITGNSIAAQPLP